LNEKISSLLSEKDKKKFKRLQELGEQENFSAMKPVYEELLKNNTDIPLLRAGYANTLKFLGEYEASETEFRRAIALDPKHEASSLGLFHLLYRIGKKKEAFQEMMRFESVGGISEDYSEFVREINRDEFQ